MLPCEGKEYEEPSGVVRVRWPRAGWCREGPRGGTSGGAGSGGDCSPGSATVTPNLTTENDTRVKKRRQNEIYISYNIVI